MGREQRDPAPLPCTLWKVVTVINIGSVSYPVDEAGLNERTARHRAALNFADYIWPQLTRAAVKENFAPPFSILPASEHPGQATTWFWEQQFKDTEDISGEFIEPVYAHLVDEQIPTQEGMEKHNKARGDDCLKGLDNIIMQFPWLWFPCSEVVKWIAEGETRKNWISPKADDVEAFAYLSIWKHCLVEMARVGGKALFVFEGIRFPTIV